MPAGRRPKPTQVKKDEGNLGKRPLNKKEPKPRPGAPVKPENLTPIASSVWDQLVIELDAMGVLTKIDGMALRVLCKTFERWRKAQDFIDEHGETYEKTDGKGKVMHTRYPQGAVVRECETTMHRIMCEFGMTPSSRSKIEVQHTSSVDPTTGDENKERDEFLRTGEVPDTYQIGDHQ